MSSLQDRFRTARDRESVSTYILQPRILHPLENEEIKILLLENISQDAVGGFRSQAFHVDHYAKAMSEDELVEKIGSYHAIGIRSKTKITERVLKSAAKVRLKVFPFILKFMHPFSSFSSLVVFVLGPTKSTSSLLREQEYPSSIPLSQTLVLWQN